MESIETVAVGSSRGVSTVRRSTAFTDVDFDKPGRQVGFFHIRNRRTTMPGARCASRSR